MLEFIMDRNVLLYVLAAACAVGVVSQLILKQVYAGLIRDTCNTGEPSGRFPCSCAGVFSTARTSMRKSATYRR